jgi:hypothetical protein
MGAVSQALVEFANHHRQQPAPGIEVIVTPRYQITLQPDFPIPGPNNVSWIRCRPDEVDEVIREARATISPHHLPVTWTLDPEPQPPDFADHLASRGVQPDPHGASVEVMVLPIDATIEAPAIAGLEIRDALTDLATFRSADGAAAEAFMQFPSPAQGRGTAERFPSPRQGRGLGRGGAAERRPRAHRDAGTAPPQLPRGWQPALPPGDVGRGAGGRRRPRRVCAKRRHSPGRFSAAEIPRSRHLARAGCGAPRDRPPRRCEWAGRVGRRHVRPDPCPAWVRDRRLAPLLPRPHHCLTGLE